MEDLNVMSGYGVHIGALRDSDIAENNIRLHESVDISKCLLVEGEDMARCAAAVVYLSEDGPLVVWHDSSNTEMTQEEDFAIGALVLARAVHPTIGI